MPFKSEPLAQFGKVKADAPKNTVNAAKLIFERDGRCIAGHSQLWLRLTRMGASDPPTSINPRTQRPTAIDAKYTKNQLRLKATPTASYPTSD